MQTRQFWNGCRHDPRSQAGHYESYFQRANHPSRSRAFWIRYTIFSPKNDPAHAEGELWAIWFDGEKNEVISFYQALPFADCAFAKDELRAKIGASVLSQHHLLGKVEDHGRTLDWDLTFKSNSPPFLLYPEAYYARALPKAKILVGSPLARYDGVLRFSDGREERIDGWLGSQNHNWGSKHTDLYAWGQVAGFDGAPDVFLECATAKLKIAGLWTPKMSPVVLRIDGQEIALNTPRYFLFRNSGAFSDWVWQVQGRANDLTITASFSAPKAHFAVLPYRNPPGGVKRCLNTKIGRCELVLQRKGEPERRLVSANGAAFEILGDPRSLDGLGFSVSSSG